DLLEPVAVALGELLVLHAEPPVGIAIREPAQRGDLGDLVVVADLEDAVVEVQPIRAGVRLGLELHLAEFRREIMNIDRRHGRHPDLLRFPVQSLRRPRFTGCSIILGTRWPPDAGPAAWSPPLSSALVPGPLS